MQNRETQQGFFAEAIGQFERLAKTHPDADHYKSTLAGMLNEFGIMHARARQADQAEAAWRRVLEIHHELIRAHPANVFYQSLAADVGGNLGTLALFEQNRPEAALAALHESCAISERLVRNHPLIRYYAHNLRTTSANLELVCKHLGRLPEALETDDRVLSQLDEEFPAASRGKDVNQLYVNWLGRRAETLRRMERFDEALKDCDRALELVDEADRGAYLIWRRTIEAFVALRDRDFRRAAELAAVVATGPNNDAQRCAQVARIYAQAAALAGGGATSAVDRAVAGGGLADQYAASAFAQLRTAARLGAFQYGFEREALATDPAFSILKGRADFQKWLEELTPK
jgi:tetratricopeptide (TPR) repeat protein